jgi:hypothetical protein
VLDALRAMPDESFDALLSDVPYGLGTSEPTVDEIVAYLRGDAHLDTGGDFMSRPWQVPSVAVWREIYRVLRHGAHLLVFASTRTWDLISLGLRAAGFENRNTIANYGPGDPSPPALTMVAGKGYPHGINISKAIDAAAGAEREVVGRDETWAKLANKRERNGTWSGKGAGFQNPQTVGDITAPATPEAARWDGYNTALKGVWEAILCFRKPLVGTIVENALQHGVGGLNIDGARIYTDWSERPDSWKESGHSAKPAEGKMAAPPGAGINCHPKGRWPANVTLVHSNGCVPIGKREIVSRAGHLGTRGGGFGCMGLKSDRQSTQRGTSKAGTKYMQTEEVTAWDCAPTCPVRLMDEQSGVLTSGKLGPVTSQKKNTAYGTFAAANVNTCAPNEGGASRFFYVAKPSRAEREFGTEALKRYSVTEINGRDPDSIGTSTPAAGAGRQGGGTTNPHPCVKSIDLDRWLATLILPPPRADGAPRRILIPYAGSGSEMIGALRAGWDQVVGVERSPCADDPMDFIAIAEARIRRWMQVPADFDVEGALTRAGEADPPDERQPSLFGGAK